VIKKSVNNRTIQTKSVNKLDELGNIALPYGINREFAVIALFNYNNNGAFAILIMKNLDNQGYSRMEIDVMMENLEKSAKNRNKILGILRSSNQLYLTLKTMGMTATSAKYLTEYVLDEKNNIKFEKE
jgi:hypothetical protein